MNKEKFINELKKLNINITKQNLENLDKYYNLLKEWNKKFNLTRIIEEEDVYLKHFYDSLCILKTIDLKKYYNVLDIGCGAGFPGIVLSIFFPHLNLTLVESNNKKCIFLNEVKRELNLHNVQIFCERAEIFCRNNIEKFDIATCRAVSHLSIICELCIPAIKKEGYFLPLKASLNEELTESYKKIKDLNSEIINIFKYTLPYENSERSIPVIIKKGETNKIYPREYNKIIKDLEKIRKMI